MLMKLQRSWLVGGVLVGSSLLPLVAGCDAGSGTSESESAADAGSYEPVRVFRSDASSLHAADAGRGAAADAAFDAAAAPAPVVSDAVLSVEVDAAVGADGGIDRANGAPPRQSEPAVAVRDAAAELPPREGPLRDAQAAASAPPSEPPAQPVPPPAQPPAERPAPPPVAPPPLPQEPLVDAAVAIEPEAAPPAPVTDAAVAVQPCVAGRYTGTFTGLVVPAPGMTVSVSGAVVFELALSADRTKLVLSSGVVSASDPSGTPIDGQITGQVDCTSLELENGKLSGTYGAAGAPSMASFSGDVSGTYTREPPSLAGRWTAAVHGMAAQASGSFSAALE
ncbi:MAG: hypothetical protein JWN04_1328 [Myxococcaceae bacterium]|nr:hypothetical protein [Myxococcaceae bacterium]